MAFRTKKISQMDPKGSNLASTDLLEISELVSGSYVTKSITGAEIIASVPASVTAWGTITGTLSSQTDLNTALSGKVPTTRTLTINGTTQDLSADRTFTISTGITIGTTAITSGTNGRFLFDDAGVVSETNGAFWDKVNGRWGIGTSSPLNPLHIKGVSDVLNIDNAGGRYTTAILSNNGTGKAQWTFDNNTNLVYFGPYSTNGGLVLRSNGVDRMTIFGSTGNIGINTTTDAGFKLDVNGTARVNNMFSVTNASFTGSLRMESFANNQQRIIGGPSENITFGSGNTITLNTGEAYFSGSLLGNAFWMTSNGSTVIGAQANPPASALVEIRSTTKGFLPPRMTTTQKNAIATPAAGLVVYDSTLNKLCVRTASAWETITSL